MKWTKRLFGVNRQVERLANSRLDPVMRAFAHEQLRTALVLHLDYLMRAWRRAARHLFFGPDRGYWLCFLFRDNMNRLLHGED